MSSSSHNSHPRYLRRLKALSKILTEEREPTAFLLSSAVPAVRSHDAEYPYHPHHDMLYLTGSPDPGLTLLISTNHNRPFLFAVPPSPKELIWNGKENDPHAVASGINAELILTPVVEREVREKLAGHRVLFFSNRPGSLAARIGVSLIQEAAGRAPLRPRRFGLTEDLVTRLRTKKDADEVRFIRRAIKVTHNALSEVSQLCVPGSTEREIARALQASFFSQGAEEAFKTIVASGPSAAVLHAKVSDRKLRKGEMLLIDCGASVHYYNADLSRTLPIGGEFLTWQQALVDHILLAKREVAKNARPGKRFEEIHSAALEPLVEGLKCVGILKGRTPTLIREKSYAPYFPHGIGHGLGLDVHDPDNLRGPFGEPLKEGMVITIEPGLYLRKGIKGIPACGIRIEDDYLITANGAVELGPL
jgi:Xaa-Pro aminopeptidase